MHIQISFTNKISNKLNKYIVLNVLCIFAKKLKWEE